MSIDNILSAWRKAGLFPYNSEELSLKIPIQERPKSPPESPVVLNGKYGVVKYVVSPDKTDEFNAFIDRSKANPLDEEAEEGMRACSMQAMADKHIYKKANHDLVEAARLKEDKKSKKMGMLAKRGT